MVNAEKWVAKLEKWGAMPTCYRLTFVLLTLFSQLSGFFKLCIMNRPTASLFGYVSHAVVSGMYPGWPAYPLPRLYQKGHRNRFRAGAV